MAAKKSAWATQVDDEEASGDTSLAPLPAAFAAAGPEAAFPSLGDAAKVVETKAEKKKKMQKMSLADFNSGGSKPAAGAPGKFSVASVRQRTAQKEADDVLKNLPRGPRMDRDPSEAPGIGGGFRDYGGNRGSEGGFGDRDRDRDRRGGFGDRGGGFGDRDDASQASDDDGPSRADMADDWGASRKFTPSSAQPDDRREERRGFGSGGFVDREPRRGFSDREEVEDAGPSRADTSDNWGKNRAALPAEPPRGSAFGERRSGFGEGGFKDRRDSDLFSGGGRADEVGTWGRSSGGGGGDRDRDSGSSWGGPRRYEGGGGGDAPSSGGERKRLQLAPRTKPAPVIEVKAEPAAEEAAPEQTPEAEEQPPQPRKPRSNPFGAARPREEVLAEKTPPASVTSADGDRAQSSAGSERGAAAEEGGAASEAKPVEGSGTETAERAIEAAAAELKKAEIEA